MSDQRAKKISNIQPVTVAMFLSLLCAPLENIIIVDGKMSNVVYSDEDVIKHSNDYDFLQEVPVELLDKQVQQVITDEHCSYVINIGERWDLLHW